jgi:hypothetical protein
MIFIVSGRVFQFARARTGEHFRPWIPGAEIGKHLFND